LEQDARQSNAVNAGHCPLALTQQIVSNTAQPSGQTLFLNMSLLFAITDILYLFFLMPCPD
jgi:hypothetical protein